MTRKALNGHLLTLSDWHQTGGQQATQMMTLQTSTAHHLKYRSKSTKIIPSIHGRGRAYGWIASLRVIATNNLSPAPPSMTPRRCTDFLVLIRTTETALSGSLTNRAAYTTGRSRLTQTPRVALSGE